MSEADFIEFDDFDPEDLERKESKEAVRESEVESRILALLELRKRYYSEVFSPGNTSSEALDFVYNDLGRFCRAHTATFDLQDGPHADTLMKIKEGRREVFMRIRDFARLSLDSLFIKYTDANSK